MGGKPGRKPGTHTMLHNGCMVTNESVVEEIKTTLQEDFLEYGYHKVTWDLKDRGYTIGKKTYRLMKEHHLLLKRHKK